MFKERSLALNLRLAFGGSLAGAALVSVPAFAQDVQRGDKVEVTGSSIKRIDAETALPVQVLTREDITRLAPQSTEDLLKTISATNTAGALQTSTGISATTSGASTVSLRGLGSKRTLVLVNGRRIAPFGSVAGGGGAASVDVNSIPIAAIERVEVLKDGASAIYGSDAVAGVINFILRKDYVGADLSIGYGQTTHGGDGRVWNENALVGFGDLSKDRFNVMVNASHSHEDPIVGRQRTFASSSVNVAEGNDTTSGNTYPGTIVNAGGASRSFLAPKYAAQVASGIYPTFGFTNCAPSIASPLFANDRCRFDPAPFIQLIPGQNRTAASVQGRFAIDANNQVYAEIGGSRNVVRTQLQPTPISDQFALPASDPYTPQLVALINSYQPILDNTYGPTFVSALLGHTTFLLPTTSPYYPTRFAADQGLAGSPIDIRYRSFENGLRQFRDVNKATRFLAGLQGTAANWDYDVGVLYTESRVNEFVEDGYPLYTRLLPLLNSGVVNPFGPSTAAVQAKLQAANFKGEAFNSKTSLTSLNGRASREVFNLTAGAVSIAVGADVRKEKYAFAASSAIASGDVSGYGGNFVDVSKSRNVEAAFAEINVPILKGLEGNVAVRYDNYQGVGNTTNPKASLRWQPAREFLLRGSIGTGFRAPALDELYAPVTTGVSQNGLSDPVRCPVTGSSNDCQTQFATLNGGNPSLAPEKTTSKTFGFVLEPSSNVHVGVDYFDIYLKNQIVIGGVGATAVLTDANSAAQYASLITRAPANGGLPGQILSINQQNQNLFNARVQGIDLDFKLRVPTAGVGSFTFGLNGTYFTRYDTQNADGSYTGNVADANIAGGPVIPRWKHIASVNWDYGPWIFSAVQNFQAAYNDVLSRNTQQARRVGVYETFDLQTSYLGFKGFRLTAGIKNVFDKDPPYSNIGGQVNFQGGYDSTYADVRGRFIYGRIGYTFK